MSKLYCHGASHDPYYCTCKSTCDICGIACEHSTSEHLENDRMNYEDWLDSLAKEVKYDER